MLGWWPPVPFPRGDSTLLLLALLVKPEGRRGKKEEGRESIKNL